MSIFFRPRHPLPPSSYESWKDVFEPYLSALYDLLVRGLRSGGIPCEKDGSYESFCAFVFRFSSKEIPGIFFKEFEESWEYADG